MVKSKKFILSGLICFAFALCCMFGAMSFNSSMTVYASGTQQEPQLISETIVFNNKKTAESEHFTLTANYVDGDGWWGGWKDNVITITPKSDYKNLLIKKIEAVVGCFGRNYNEVGVSSGIKAETWEVLNGSTVHINDVNEFFFSFAGGSSYSQFKDITVYYVVDTHSSTEITAKPATETEHGYTTTHYYCEICGKYFADESCQNEITKETHENYIIHNFSNWEKGDANGHYPKCTVDDCDAKSPPEAHTGYIEDSVCDMCGYSGMYKETIFFNNSLTAESEHFALTANEVDNNGWKGGYNKCVLMITPRQGYSNLLIKNIETMVSSHGSFYNEVGVSSGTKAETGNVENETTVHINNVNETYFSFDGGTYYSQFKDITIYYTVKPRLEKPTADTTNFVYDGTAKTYNLMASEFYTINGDLTQTNAGKYTITVVLKDKANMAWKDETTDDLTFDFVIAKAQLTDNTQDVSLTYDGKDHVDLDIIESIINIVDDNGNVIVPNSKQYSVDDKTYVFGTSINWNTFEAINVGDYTIYYQYEYKNCETVKSSFTITIEKAEVTAPTANTTNFVYDGTAKTYTLATSELYTISNNVQTDAGTYDVTVALNDKTNYKWANGNSENLTFKFVINQKLDTVEIKQDGEVITDKSQAKVSIIEANDGIAPDAVFVVKTIPNTNTEIINNTENVLRENNKLEKQEVVAVYDAKLLINGDIEKEVQPNGTIKIKMLVPTDLQGKNFVLYHIHNGTEVDIVDYTAVDENGYITFETDKLSEFAFAVDNPTLSALAIVAIVIGGIVVLALIAYILGYFFLYRKCKLDDKKIKVVYKILPRGDK